MNPISAYKIAKQIYNACMAHKRNNGIEFSHNINVIKYIASAIIVRNHFKTRFNTLKYNNVKVPQDQYHYSVNLFISEMDTKEYIKLLQSSFINAIDNRRKIIYQITIHLIKTFTVRYIVDNYLYKTIGTDSEFLAIFGKEKFYIQDLVPTLELIEDSFIGTRKFNVRYDNYYIVSVYPNKVFNFDEYERLCKSSINFIINDHNPDWKPIPVKSSNLYLVFHPNAHTAYLYKQRKRGYKFIKSIYKGKR